MVEQSGGDWGFRKLTDLFQQMAGGIDLRTFQDYATWGSRSALEALIDVVRARLVGRRIDSRIGGQDISLTLAALDVRLEPMGATAGQAEDVTLAATDVEYAGIQLRMVTAVLDNLHTRIGTRPTLVSAPVEVNVSATCEAAANFVHRFVPRLHVSCEGPDDGPVRLRWRRHRSWAWVDARVAVEGGRVTVRPTGVGVGRWGRRLRGAWPAYTLPLSLPANVRVVGIDVSTEGVDVELRLDEWRVDYQQILRLTPRTA